MHHKIVCVCVCVHYFFPLQSGHAWSTEQAWPVPQFLSITKCWLIRIRRQEGKRSFHGRESENIPGLVCHQGHPGIRVCFSHMPHVWRPRLTSISREAAVWRASWFNPEVRGGLCLFDAARFALLRSLGLAPSCLRYRPYVFSSVLRGFTGVELRQVEVSSFGAARLHHLESRAMRESRNMHAVIALPVAGASVGSGQVDGGCISPRWRPVPFTRVLCDLSSECSSFCWRILDSAP